MRVGGRTGRVLATTALLLLGPAVAWSVATKVQIQSPAGEPVESDYLVLDEQGETVAEGRTDAEGEDEQELRPGVYIFRSGDREQRVEIREGQPSATVSLTRSLVGLRSWGFDVGATYGYLDQDGTLASEIQPFTDRESSALQLNGTFAGLYGRIRFPAELAGGQPFVQVGGELDLSDSEDSGGLSGQIGMSEVSGIDLEYEGGLTVGGGVEWETPPLHGDRGLRLRPFGGLAFGWYDARIENDRSAFGLPAVSDGDDFTTTNGHVGFELGVPLCGCEQMELDLVLGSRLDFPMGDDEEELETGAGPSLMQSATGTIDFDESWRAYTGLEMRWSPSLRY